MKKNTENLIALIEPFLQSNYEWEKAVNDITYKEGGMAKIIATPDYNKRLCADVFKNLTERQYVFIEEIIRVAQNYALISGMKANGTFDQEVKKFADEWIEEHKQYKKRFDAELITSK